MVEIREHRLLRVSWWLAMAWLWGAFWLYDLRFANAEDTLLLLPLGGIAVRMAGGRFEVGLLGALFLCWLYFLDRSLGIGCSGVSVHYEKMLSGTGVAFLACAICCLVGIIKTSSKSARGF